MQRCRWPPYFYPRPPRGGRLCRFRYICGLQFHFYPRPPRGGRRSQASAKKYNSAISIHALREEGDQASPRSCSPFLYHFYPRPPRGGRPSAPTAVCKARRNFYPRPPRGGRHLRMAIALQHIFISIHALREEGDCITVKSMHRAKQFLSTPSARRATHQHQG